MRKSVTKVQENLERTLGRRSFLKAVLQAGTRMRGRAIYLPINELLCARPITNTDIVKCWHDQVWLDSLPCQLHHAANAVVGQNDFAISICQVRRYEKASDQTHLGRGSN